jgi:hypothetical protein
MKFPFKAAITNLFVHRLIVLLVVIPVIMDKLLMNAFGKLLNDDTTNTKFLFQIWFSLFSNYWFLFPGYWLMRRISTFYVVSFSWVCLLFYLLYLLFQMVLYFNDKKLPSRHYFFVFSNINPKLHVWPLFCLILSWIFQN